MFYKEEGNSVFFFNPSPHLSTLFKVLTVLQTLVNMFQQIRQLQNNF